MDTAVVMVQPLKRPLVQRAPPGIPPTTFRNTTQSQMSGLTPSQQAQAIANPQQQAILANDGCPAAPVISNPTLLLLYIIKSLLIVKNQGVKLARDMMIKDTVMLTNLGLVEPA